MSRGRWVRVSRVWLEERLWMSVSELSRQLGVSETGSAVRRAVVRFGLQEEFAVLHRVSDGCPCGRHDPRVCRARVNADEPVSCEVFDAA